MKIKQIGSLLTICLISLFLPAITSAQDSTQQSSIERKLDGFDWNLFKPYAEDPGNHNGYLLTHKLWQGELYLRGTNLINLTYNGYEIYDIFNLQYRNVKYAFPFYQFSYGEKSGIDNSDKISPEDGVIGGWYSNNISDGKYYYQQRNNFLYKVDFTDLDYSRELTYKPDALDISMNSAVNKNVYGGFELEQKSKIYTYHYTNKYNENPFRYDYTDSNFVVGAQVKPIQNDFKYLLLSLNILTEDGLYSTVKKIININNIIDSYNLPNVVRQDYGVIDVKQGYDWTLQSIRFLGDKMLIIVNVEQSFSRYSPYEIHGIPIDYKTDIELGILLNKDMSLKRAEKILVGDQMLLSNNGKNMYSIINNGAKVICYDNDLNIKWFKQYGIDDDNTGDEIDYAKEINGFLYLMGTTKNKYHVGKPDPIVWKANVSTGILNETSVMKFNNPPPRVTGFLVYANSLYLLLSDEGTHNSFQTAGLPYRCFLTKVPLSLGTNIPDKPIAVNIVSSSNELTGVNIGSQVWSTTNLNVSHFRNGDTIPEAKTEEDWLAAEQNHSPAWCYYDNDYTIYGRKYGKLYNWYAVTDPRGLAPMGWHIPTDAEWTKLINALGDYTIAGSKMKASCNWIGEKPCAPNTSGFTALPSGIRNNHARFEDILRCAYWWASDELNSYYGMSRFIRTGSDVVYRNYTLASIKSEGLSVRLIKD